MSQNTASLFPIARYLWRSTPAPGVRKTIFHIHISCIRPDVREQLDNNLANISSRWLPLPGGLRGHEYLARRVTESELVQRSPFMMLAEEVPEAREHMGSYGLAMVRQVITHLYCWRHSEIY